jgi:hypothetical protein
MMDGHIPCLLEPYHCYLTSRFRVVLGITGAGMNLQAVRFIVVSDEVPFNGRRPRGSICELRGSP